MLYKEVLKTCAIISQSVLTPLVIISHIHLHMYVQYILYLSFSLSYL